MKETADERFDRHVDRSNPSGCWPWTGSRNKGYGQFKINGRTVRAHRYAYERAYGPIPPGAHVHHMTEDECVLGPACCNPEHMMAVTPAVHARVGTLAEKRRGAYCVNGHRFTPENTYVDPRGHRQCRTCRRLRARRSRRARRVGA